MLEVRNLAVSYGRHRALEGVSVAVAPGEICVILGANGAGKSTLLKAIAGMVPPEPGAEVAINGRQLAGARPNRIVEAGVALVPEGRGIFADLTVAENLQLGAFARRARRHEAATMRQILELFPRLGERRSQVVRSMSGGEQQMVAIGRALMSRPEILMLDEPSLGLAPKLSSELFRSLADVASTGVGILLVEQNARQSLKIARRGYLIENGSVMGENTAAELMHDPAVINAYLGGAAAPAAARMALPPALPLPADPAAIAALTAELADRAGSVHAAFVRSARQHEPLPAAFVGRYDPKAAGDPWAELARPAPAPRPKPPDDARRLARDAAALAERAAERLVVHVATTRLSAPQPSAFRRPLQAPPPALPEAEPRALIGHNSASAALDAAPSIEALAARAASIHAAHVAERRKTLTAFTVPDPKAPATAKKGG